MDLEKLKEMHNGLLVPDLTLIFDCSAELAFERRRKAGATDVFDKDLQFQEDLRQNYLKLKTSLPDENIVIIDATDSIDKVFEKVKYEVERAL